MGGLGIELVQSPWFALDIQGRIGYGFYQSGGAGSGLFLLGFTWY
jgi:hypothetical protein